MFKRFDMVQGLKKIDEVKTAGREFDAVQVFGCVSDRRSQTDLICERARARNRLSTDVDTGEGPESEAALFEDPIEMSGAAPKRQGVSGVASGKVPVTHPVDPVRLAAAGYQVIVVEVNLRNARPRDPLEIMNEGLGCEPRPAARNFGGIAPALAPGTDRPPNQVVPCPAKRLENGLPFH